MTDPVALELTPTQVIIGEALRKGGAILSVEDREVEMSYTQSKILDAVIEMDNDRALFGEEELERKKQLDRVRGILAKMVKAGVVGEVKVAVEGKGKGYYVNAEAYAERKGRTSKPQRGGPRTKKPREVVSDEERMARPEWGRNLSKRQYTEWDAWKDDFFERKLKGDLAVANGVNLPEDFSTHELATMWGAGGGGYNERKLLKELRAKYPLPKDETPEPAKGSELEEMGNRVTS